MVVWRVVPIDRSLSAKRPPLSRQLWRCGGAELVELLGLQRFARLDALRLLRRVVVQADLHRLHRRLSVRCGRRAGAGHPGDGTTAVSLR